jgi:hypothetical protein
MQLPTKLVLVGLSLAALIGLLGWLNQLRLEANLRSAEEKCEQVNRINAGKQGMAGDRVVCDASELSPVLDPFFNPPGVQGEVVAAQRALWKHSSDAFAIAAVCVFIFFALPWCWYFPLRRLREVSDALRGR